MFATLNPDKKCLFVLLAVCMAQACHDNSADSGDRIDSEFDTGLSTENDSGSHTGEDTENSVESDTGEHIEDPLDSGTGEEIDSENQPMCKFERETYHYKEHFFALDGCRCACMPGGVVSCSTIHGCGADCHGFPNLDAGPDLFPDPPDVGDEPYCDYYGKLLKLEEITRGVPDATVWCDVCTFATQGAIVPTKPTKCIYHGRDYSYAERFPAIDGCNHCTCWLDESVTCTTTWECQD